MVVSITWAESTGGGAISEPLNWGNIRNTTLHAADDLYIRHDGSNPITNCGFYIQPYSGVTYPGDASANADYNEMVYWGNRSTSSRVSAITDLQATIDGGFWINQNAAGGFAPYSWIPHRGGQGVVGTEILLSDSALSDGSAVCGTIGINDEAHIRVLVIVPNYEGTSGIRAFDQVLSFSYTS